MAVFGSVTVAQRAGELAHLAVHSQDTNHHHHADHGLHMDDDDSLVQHLHADSGTHATGLLTSLQPTPAPGWSMSPIEASQVIWHSPTLEGPLRPPMQNT